MWELQALDAFSPLSLAEQFLDSFGNVATDDKIKLTETSRKMNMATKTLNYLKCLSLHVGFNKVNIS